MHPALVVLSPRFPVFLILVNLFHRRSLRAQHSPHVSWSRADGLKAERDYLGESLTLASCSLTKKRVTVARELQPVEYKRWLEPLLYHEMCHAVLGLEITRPDGKRAWHGKEFKELERRHPETSPFHSWVNEGGWSRAVRSDRAKRAAHKRQKR